MGAELNLRHTMQVSKKQTNSEKYHRAAVDGYVDMLCDASKRDANLPLLDESRATPTHLAAQFGQLEALRILVGRGGEPERCTSDGSSALHLAASRNHLNCVSFLVNFGVNLWALDNELRTAKDVAALASDRVGRDSLDYLDCAMAKQSAINTKSVQKLKQRAKLGAEKRLKSVRKAQLKAIKQAERDERFLVRLSHQRRLLKAAHSMSDIKLVGRDHTRGGVSGGRDYLFREMLNSRASSASSQTSLAGSVSMSNLTASAAPADRCAASYLMSRFAARKQSNTQSALAAATNALSASAAESPPADAAPIPQGAPTSSATRMRPATNVSGAAHQATRPKYSDLVAVSFSPDSCAGSSGAESGANSSSRSSVKSQSTIASRLRAIGGVSRKVHLRRLLLPTAAPAPHAAGRSASGAEWAECDTRPPAAESAQRRPPEQRAAAAAAAASAAPDGRQGGKLCNVRPANKLRLGPGSDSKRTCVAGWASGLEPAQPAEAELAVAARTGPAADADEQAAAQLKSHTSRCAPPIEPPAPPPLPMGPLGGGGGRGRTPVLGHTTAVAQRNLIAEQCFSQRKSATSCADELALAAAASNSDELLRHQINAGEFPLRPSLIKQQTSRTRGGGGGCTAPVDTAAAAHRTMGSVSLGSVGGDSIGSASSLANSSAADRLSGPGELVGAAGASAGGCLLALASRVSAAASASAATTTITTTTTATASTTSGCTGDSSSSSSSSSSDDASAPPSQQQVSQRDRCGKCATIKWAHDGDDDNQVGEFLRANGLGELGDVFARERIDLEALMLLTESDLRSLEIVLGPRRKLLNAIERRRNSGAARPEAEPAAPEASNESPPSQPPQPQAAAHAMFVMVDTQL